MSAIRPVSGVYQPMSRKRLDQPVCRACKRGYGSKFDGLCAGCRGTTAWALKNKFRKDAQ